MNIPFFNRGSKPKRDLVAEARRFRLRQNLRALLLVLPVAAGIIALIAVFLAGSSKPDVPLNNWNKTPAFSGVHDTKQIMEVLKASRAAFNEYIKRDVVAKRLDLVAKLFDGARSEADLRYALAELVRASGDKYAEVLTINEYQDRLARMEGKTIGIDLDFDNRWGSKDWTISRCPPEGDAYAQGLREGDVLFSIDETHVDQLGLGNSWQGRQRLKQILDGGLLGSTVKIICRRDDVFVEAYVQRVVVATWQSQPSFNASTPWGRGGQMEDSRVISIASMWNPDTLPGVTEALKQYESEQVRGLILDLQQVNGCEPETAIRMAALFMDKGVITHEIRVLPTGELIMKTWEAVNGKVKLTTKGPFAVKADGSIESKAKEAPKEEMLDWESNVFTGTVVVVMSDETSGGGEVISAALMSDIKKHVVTSAYLTAGKGTYQAYYPVGPDYVIAISTGFFLRPDGQSIEKGADGKGGRIMPNAIPRGIQSDSQIMQWAQQLLEERLRVIPLPDLPPEPGVDPAKKPGDTSKAPAKVPMLPENHST